MREPYSVEREMEMQMERVEEIFAFIRDAVPQMRLTNIYERSGDDGFKEFSFSVRGPIPADKLPPVYRRLAMGDQNND